jgi:MFS family permease
MTPSSNTAIELLRENRPFRSLWAARSISFIGDSLGSIALLIYVATTQDSGTAVALLLLVGDFAPTLLCPFSGTLSDRIDRKRLMIGSEIAQGGIIATIALVSMPLAPMLVLVAVRTTLAGIFQPASRSAVTSLVSKTQLGTANATLGFGTHGFELIGPLAGAALLPTLGLRGMLLADAITFVVSALLILRLPSLPPVHLEDGDRLSFLQDARDGLRMTWRFTPVRIIALGFCGGVAFSGSDDVALVFLATGPLVSGEGAASLMYAGAGTGLLVEFAVVAGFGGRLSMLAVILARSAVAHSGNLLTGLAWSIPAAFAMQVIRGIGISLIDVGVNTTVQRIVPTRRQGRVFANVYGFVGIAAGLSYAVGGPLLDAAGARAVLLLAGIGGLAATAWLAIRLPAALREHECVP